PVVSITEASMINCYQIMHRLKPAVKASFAIMTGTHWGGALQAAPLERRDTMLQEIHLEEKRTRRLDLLAVPGLRQVLLWKHNRTAAQIVLFTLAAIMVLDGWLGSPLAAKNVATVAAWVHYRGFIILALLLAGNLFCAGCPFILPR